MINVLTLCNQTFVSGSASDFIPWFQFKRSSQFIQHDPWRWNMSLF